MWAQETSLVHGQAAGQTWQEKKKNEKALRLAI
jgi:hypothetical protein